MYFHCVLTVGSLCEIVINNADLISVERPLLTAESVGSLMFCNYTADFMYIN